MFHNGQSHSPCCSRRASPKLATTLAALPDYSGISVLGTKMDCSNGWLVTINRCEPPMDIKSTLSSQLNGSVPSRFGTPSLATQNESDSGPLPNT